MMMQGLGGAVPKGKKKSNVLGDEDDMLSAMMADMFLSGAGGGAKATGKTK